MISHVLNIINLQEEIIENFWTCLSENIFYFSVFNMLLFCSMCYFGHVPKKFLSIWSLVHKTLVLCFSYTSFRCMKNTLPNWKQLPNSRAFM